MIEKSFGLFPELELIRYDPFTAGAIAVGVSSTARVAGTVIQAKARQQAAKNNAAALESQANEILDRARINAIATEADRDIVVGKIRQEGMFLSGASRQALVEAAFSRSRQRILNVRKEAAFRAEQLRTEAKGQIAAGKGAIVGGILTSAGIAAGSAADLVSVSSDSPKSSQGLRG